MSHRALGPQFERVPSHQTDDPLVCEDCYAGAQDNALMDFRDEGRDPSVEELHNLTLNHLHGGYGRCSRHASGEE